MNYKYHTAKFNSWIVDLEIEDGISNGSIHKENNPDIGASLAWLFNEDCVYDAKDKTVNVPKSIIEKVRMWAELRGW